MRWLCLVAGCLAAPPDIDVERSRESPDLSAPDAAPDDAQDAAGKAADLSSVPIDLGGGDLAVIFVATACDLVQQTGCPAGQKCVFSPVDKITPGCTPVGSVVLAIGEQCTNTPAPPTATDDCTPGLVCTFSHNGTLRIGVCTQLCNVTSDCKQALVSGSIALTCEPFGDNVGHYCTVSCNPVGAADGTQGCPAQTACNYYFDNDPNPDLVDEAADCVVIGIGQEGDDCTLNPPSCGPGLTCLGNALQRSCKRVCRLGSQSVCKATQHCDAVPTVRSPVYGVCN